MIRVSSCFECDSHPFWVQGWVGCCGVCGFGGVLGINCFQGPIAVHRLGFAMHPSSEGLSFGRSMLTRRSWCIPDATHITFGSFGSRPIVAGCSAILWLVVFRVGKLFHLNVSVELPSASSLPSIVLFSARFSHFCNEVQLSV